MKAAEFLNLIVFNNSSKAAWERIETVVVGFEGVTAFLQRLHRATVAVNRATAAAITFQVSPPAVTITMSAKVLLVGNELLSSALIQALDNRGFEITVLTRTGLPVPNSPRAVNYVLFDLEKSSDCESLLGRYVRNAAIVVSLTASDYQNEILRVCIEHKRHMITPFVLSTRGRYMEHEALDAGITIMSETGVSPGLDHVTSIALMERLRESGQHVLRFETYYGELPMPMCANNPFKFKFSRAAVEALTSVVRAVRYIENDQVHSIKSADIMKFCKLYQRSSPSTLPMEAYFNGDSTAMILQYGLQGVQTYARYVVRYEGFCKLMKGLVELGLLDLGKKPVGDTWLAVLTEILSGKEALRMALPEWVPASAEEIVLKALNVMSEDSMEQRMTVIQALNYVGALATTPVGEHPSVLHAFSSLLDQALPYRSEERDFLFLDHIITYESGGISCELRAALEAEGVQSQCSAATKLAGLHIAAAVLWISRGVGVPGLMLPLQPEYVEFVLAEMQREGVTMSEKSAGIQPSIA